MYEATILKMQRELAELREEVDALKKRLEAHQHESNEFPGPSYIYNA